MTKTKIQIEAEKDFIKKLRNFLSEKQDDIRFLNEKDADKIVEIIEQIDKQL